MYDYKLNLITTDFGQSLLTHLLLAGREDPRFTPVETLRSNMY
jgi:hypothetical protein